MLNLLRHLSPKQHSELICFFQSSILHSLPLQFMQTSMAEFCEIHGISECNKQLLYITVVKPGKQLHFRVKSYRATI